MALKENLLFLKKKKQKDFFNFAGRHAVVPSCCGGIAVRKSEHKRATIESIARVFLLLFLQKKKSAFLRAALGWTPRISIIYRNIGAWRGGWKSGGINSRLSAAGRRLGGGEMRVVR